MLSRLFCCKFGASLLIVGTHAKKVFTNSSFYDIIKLVRYLIDKLEFDEVMDVCSNTKKMIAPIIVTVIMVLYYVVYFGFLITLLPSIWKYALGIIPLGFSVVMVKVCIERINEIKKGDEDDISKY